MRTAEDRWTLPEPGSRYPLALLARGIDPDQASVRFFGIVALVVAVAGYTVASTSVNMLVEWLGWLVDGRPGTLAEYATRSSAFETVAGLVAANLAIGAAILVVAGLLRLLHRRRATWMWSVSPGVRWRFLLACFLVGVVVLVGLQFIISGVPVVTPQNDIAAFVVAILVTSPIQAAAEEVFFRGYVMQALGLVWRREWFAVVGSALLFALFHGTQNLPLFFHRFCFGLIMGALVWRTGGLEASIGAHIANNLGAFLWAALTSSVAQARAVQELTWVGAAEEIAAFAVFALIAWWIAGRMRVPATVGAGLSLPRPLR
ncbi:MAG: CPBP family intramembrane glutamic endopeptidase [Propionibacteriaceae bacterium]